VAARKKNTRTRKTEKKPAKEEKQTNK